MGTVTEQELIAPQVLGGNAIATHPLKLSNYNLKNVITTAADLIKGVLECDSANSSAQVSPVDAEMVKLGWERVELEWRLSQEFKNLSKGGHEREFWCTIPTDNEVATADNIQAQRLSEALLSLIYIGLGSDSAKMQFYSGPKLIREMEKVMNHVKVIIGIYWADGGETAQEMPEYPTGTLTPQTDLGFVSLREPSTETPEVGVPDVADRPSIAPRPATQHGGGGTVYNRD